MGTGQPDRVAIPSSPWRKWQDGSPFTAADVLFTVKRATGKHAQLIPNFSSVKDIRKGDDVTVDLGTQGPDPLRPP